MEGPRGTRARRTTLTAAFEMNDKPRRVRIRRSWRKIEAAWRAIHAPCAVNRDQVGVNGMEAQCGLWLR